MTFSLADVDRDTAAVRPFVGSDLAGLPRHIGEAELELIGLSSKTVILDQRATAVKCLEPHLLRVLHHVYVLDSARRIVPVTQEVDGGLVVLRGLHGVIRFFGQPHCIHHAAHARDLGIRHATMTH